jgi:hypothetical protein
MKGIVYLCCIISLCISCKNTKPDTHNIEAVYTVNLDSIKPEGVPLMTSAIFKNVKTVILEDHDYAVIGMISELQVFENNIFILDNTFAKKLFVFDKNGKYIRQIGSKGQGPGEYSSIDDFCINGKKREIYLLDDNGRIFVHDLDTGKHLNTVKFRHDELSYKYLAYCDNKLYTAILPYDYRKKSNLLMELDLETGKQKEYLDADTYNYGWNRPYFGPNNFFSAKLSDSLKFLALYMNTVMNIDKDGVHPYLTVNHKNWVQSSDMWTTEKLEKQQTDQSSILMSKQRTWLLQPNYFETDKYICFKYNSEYRPHIAMFDKRTRETRIYDYLRNDLRGQIFSNSSLKFYDSNAAYEWIDPQFMPAFVASLKTDGNNLPLNLDKREEVLKLNEESTVIFEYEFK